MDSGRRSFLTKLARLAGGAVVLFAGGGVNGLAQTVSEADRRLINSTEGFRTRRGRATGYLSRPIGAGPPQPAILVIHGDEGLTPHYRDVARRLALEGSVVLAPDFLSLAQGTPEDPQFARSAMARLDNQLAIAIAMGAVDFMVARRDTQRRLGIVGYAWGGRLAQELALESRDVIATVSYNGQLLDPQRAARLRTPLMVHLAGDDQDPDAALTDFREALDTAGAGHAIHVYEDAARGFHDETSEAYDDEAAALAWTRTVSFLSEELG